MQATRKLVTVNNEGASIGNKVYAMSSTKGTRRMLTDFYVGRHEFIKEQIIEADRPVKF